MIPAVPRLVLASQSPTRAALLHGAGIAFTTDAAAVDEAEIKAAFKARGARVEVAAEALAELKARRVQARHPGAFVIGADQILSDGSTWFDKPATTAEARHQLGQLAGRRHELVTAVCVLGDGERLWHHIARASLAMRPLDPTTIDRYLDLVGDQGLATPGAYRIEGPGVQLFAAVEGDYAGILGLPLLPLLAFLRGHGFGLP
ncbi:MAG: Maf family protein [Alphaproteobacteria bacterium]